MLDPQNCCYIQIPMHVCYVCLSMQCYKYHIGTHKRIFIDFYRFDMVLSLLYSSDMVTNINIIHNPLIALEKFIPNL